MSDHESTRRETACPCYLEGNRSRAAIGGGQLGAASHQGQQINATAPALDERESIWKPFASEAQKGLAAAQLRGQIGAAIELFTGNDSWNREI